jgi:hypothetical protein
MQQTFEVPCYLAAEHAAVECARILSMHSLKPPVSGLMAAIISSIKKQWVEDGGDRREAHVSREERILRMASIAVGFICNCERPALSMEAAFSKDVEHRLQRNAKISDSEVVGDDFCAVLADSHADAMKAISVAAEAKDALAAALLKNTKAAQEKANEACAASSAAWAAAKAENDKAKADNKWANARLTYFKMTGNDPAALVLHALSKRYKELRNLAAEVAAEVCAGILKKRLLKAPVHTLWATIMVNMNQQWKGILDLKKQGGKSNEQFVLDMAAKAVGSICNCAPPELSMEDAFSKDVGRRMRRNADTSLGMEAEVVAASAKVEETNEARAKAVVASDEMNKVAYATFAEYMKALHADSDASGELVAANKAYNKACKESDAEFSKKVKSWGKYCHMMLYGDASPDSPAAAAAPAEKAGNHVAAGLPKAAPAAETFASSAVARDDVLNLLTFNEAMEEMCEMNIDKQQEKPAKRHCGGGRGRGGGF